jgi:hypothetical protein
LVWQSRAISSQSTKRCSAAAESGTCVPSCHPCSPSSLPRV